MEFTGHLPAHYPHRTLNGGGEGGGAHSAPGVVAQCREVRFASFLSGGLNTIISYSSKSIGVVKRSFG